MESPRLPRSLGDSLQPQDAIDALKSRSNIEVIAFLTFARSCQQNLQYSSSSSSLSIGEFTAVLVLRDWTDEAVMRELQWARRNRKYSDQLRKSVTC